MECTAVVEVRGVETLMKFPYMKKTVEMRRFKRMVWLGKSPQLGQNIVLMKDRKLEFKIVGKIERMHIGNYLFLRCETSPEKFKEIVETFKSDPIYTEMEGE